MAGIKAIFSPATLVAMALLFLVGCATTKIDWDTRLGHYTFDEAVVELGPPDKDAVLSDGKRVAEWMTHRTHSDPYGFYMGGYGYPRYYRAYGYPGYYSPIAGGGREYWLRLVFDPQNQLTSWHKFIR